MESQLRELMRNLVGDPPHHVTVRAVRRRVVWRRLLAATEEMAPGVDLLDGFAEGRRRDRARRRRRRAVLSATAAAVAAAAVTAAVLAIGSPPPALATVTSALTRTLSQSYHLTEVGSSYSIWNGRARYRSHHSCVGAADPARHIGISSCADGSPEREVGGYTYQYISHPAGRAGKHWLRRPATSPFSVPFSVPTLSGFSAATPQQMLSAIKKAGKVTVIGAASGPGWTGTRYAFAARSAVSRLRGTVDVDQQGRARALVVTMRMPAPGGSNSELVGTQAMTFSDFGAPVTVTPPPADQTLSLPGPAVTN
jgi:hypothetical protein